MSSETTVRETIRQIVGKIIRKPDVVLDENTSFKDLGADSLDVVQILVAVESTFGIELDDEQLQSIQDTAAFIVYVESKVAARDNR